MMQSNLNAHLTDPLEELMEFLHVERDIWREYMYKVGHNIRQLSTISTLNGVTLDHRN